MFLSILWGLLYFLLHWFNNNSLHVVSLHINSPFSPAARLIFIKSTLKSLVEEPLIPLTSCAFNLLAALLHRRWPTWVPLIWPRAHVYWFSSWEYPRNLLSRSRAAIQRDQKRRRLFERPWSEATWPSAVRESDFTGRRTMSWFVWSAFFQPSSVITDDQVPQLCCNDAQLSPAFMPPRFRTGCSHSCQRWVSFILSLHGWNDVCAADFKSTVCPDRHLFLMQITGLDAAPRVQSCAYKETSMKRVI